MLRIKAQIIPACVSIIAPKIFSMFFPAGACLNKSILRHIQTMKLLNFRSLIIGSTIAQMLRNSHISILLFKQL